MSKKGKKNLYNVPCPDCGSRGLEIITYFRIEFIDGVEAIIGDEYIECDDCGYKEKNKKKREKDTSDW
jgi:DNA-directed RNA polymerase subunit RPC12/RpoP